MNEIKHFVLPEHTNTLYKEEARSSIALTKEVADKINEIVDALNAFNKTDLEWKHEQEGKIRGGILYMKDNLINTIHDLLKMYLDTGTVDMLLVEAINGSINEVLNKTKYYTPEMYGAVGDGITDDTEAFHKMIKAVEAGLKERVFDTEVEPCKDYSTVNFKFAGKYKISKPIVFNNTYGLTLDNLSLIASPTFAGDAMLKFEFITRNFNANNLTVNGNHVAKTCIWVNDYTLTFNIVNAEITQFKKYGIYADGKGHELKLVNVRVNQFEYEDKKQMLVTDAGTGIYLGENRYDNNFTNLIVNYCTVAGLELYGGSNTFVNSHFYSCEIHNEGRYNTFDDCYFDNAPFKTYGFFNLTNSLLLKSAGDTAPFIYFLVNSDANNWQYDTCIMNGNTFKAVDYVSKVIDLGALSELPHFTTVGNTFYYATPFTSHGRLGHTRNPWDEERKSYGNETSGYKIYGNLAIIWGEATENGFVYYPDGLELSETLHIGFERKDNSNPNLIPWANSIKSNQFWLNSVGTNSTVKWFVIGIVK